MRLLRDFELETFYERWEFTAKYHLSGTDMEAMSVEELLEYGTQSDREDFLKLHLGYTQTWGAPSLRDALAGSFATLKPENVLCFAGSEESMFCAMNALLDTGDHAIVTVPNYQSAETIPLSICETTGVPLDRERGWTLDVERIKDSVRANTKLLYINFPNNPTGALISASQLEEIVAICQKHGIYLISDEIFRGSELDLANRLPQAADIYERAFSMSGTSKVYALPGLRIGWIASQDTEALARMERYKHYLSICSSGPSEVLTRVAVRAQERLFARTNALKMKYLQAFEEFFDEYEALFEWRRPPAGLFGYPRFKGAVSVDEFVDRLLAATGVLFAPGRLFRSDLVPLPTDHFRIGLTRSLTREALDAARRHIGHPGHSTERHAGAGRT